MRDSSHTALAQLSTLDLPSREELQGRLASLSQRLFQPKSLPLQILRAEAAAAEFEVARRPDGT